MSKSRAQGHGSLLSQILLCFQGGFRRNAEGTQPGFCWLSLPSLKVGCAGHQKGYKKIEATACLAGSLPIVVPIWRFWPGLSISARAAEAKLWPCYTMNGE